MSGRITNCPNCGGQVEFKAGTSLLSICPYCSSAVARTGGDLGRLEILGKVAPLAAIASPLSLGLRGRYRSRDFTLIGRMQLDYGLGPWNEWYAVFDDGAWGWVAEAQGRVYVTFEKRVEGLPTYARARVDSQVNVREGGGATLTIVERRKARMLTAEGELPQALPPGREYRYCDLEGPGGAFATIDYGAGEEAEAFYLGEQLKYSDLFGAGLVAEEEHAAGATALNCPKCGYAIELRAPDEAQRVTCAACESLLDCSHDSGTSLRLLAAAKRTGPEPRIPLGLKGKLRGENYVVYGQLLKAVTISSVNYYWEEYLLRGKSGYRWLVVSDNHWSFVEPVNAGDVRRQVLDAVYQKRTFRHFQSASARVEALRGEFYWKVAVGERTAVEDCVAPPQMLSREQSDEEYSWSLGHYLEPEDVEQAFALKKKLARPRGVGAIQPNPWVKTLATLGRIGVLWSALLVLFASITAFASDNALVLGQEFALLPATPPQNTTANSQANPQANPQGPSAYTGLAGASAPFELKEEGALAITSEAPQGADWLFVNGILIEQNTQVRRSFGILVIGGNAKETVYLGEVPAGSYVVNVVPEWNVRGTGGATKMNLEVRSDPFFASHFLFALIALWCLPIIGLASYFNFEKRRWAESDHG